MLAGKKFTRRNIMRGRKRHLKKMAKKLKVQAGGKSNGSNRKEKNVKTVSSSHNASGRSLTKFACYGKSKICHIVTVDAQGVITALCGDVWTPGDEKTAPQLLDVIGDDKRLCKNCERKQ
jgi:hypothetical protein